MSQKERNDHNDLGPFKISKSETKTKQSKIVMPHKLPTPKELPSTLDCSVTYGEAFIVDGIHGFINDFKEILWKCYVTCASWSFS